MRAPHASAAQTGAWSGYMRVSAFAAFLCFHEGDDRHGGVRIDDPGGAPPILRD